MFFLVPILLLIITLLYLLPLPTTARATTDPISTTNDEDDGGVICQQGYNLAHIDSSIAAKTIAAFCATHPLTGGGDEIIINATYGGQNLNPPINNADNLGVFLKFHALSMYYPPRDCTAAFTTDAPNATRCEERFARILDFCEYDSHDYYGMNSIVEPCAMWDLWVLNCTEEITGAWPNGTLLDRGWCGAFT